MRRIIAVAVNIFVLLGGAVSASATTATHTCHFSGGPQPFPTYAGYYSGDSAVPVYGSFSNATIEAQCLVKIAWVSPGATDGVYGAETKSAIASFQHWINISGLGDLPEDGFVGPGTWPLLRKYASN